MRSTALLFIALGLTAALTGCGSRSDAAKAADDATRSARDAQDSADAAAKEANEKVLDITKSGGEPGKIELIGAIAHADLQSKGQIVLDVISGFSWRGVRPETPADSVKLTASVNDKTKTDLAILVGQKTYANFGCEKIDPKLIDGLREVKGAAFAGAGTLSAKIVFMCGEVELRAKFMFVDADTLALSNFSSKLVGDFDRMLVVKANEIEFEGVSDISLRGVDGKYTNMGGPSLTISTAKISGEGSLKIHSEGASYVEAKKH